MNHRNSRTSRALRRSLETATSLPGPVQVTTLTVSCSSAGSCVAGGNYQTRFAYQMFVT